MNDENSKSIPKLQVLAQQRAALAARKRSYEREAALVGIDVAEIDRAIAAIYRNAARSGRLSANGVTIGTALGSVVVRPGVDGEVTISDELQAI